MKTTTKWAAVLSGLALIAGAGCGGGGTTIPGAARQTAPTLASAAPAVSGGRAQIAIRWPASSKAGRLVPSASDSVRVSFVDTGGTVLQSKLVVRPDSGGAVSIDTFVDLPPGTLTVSAAAYPNADGTGVAQASVVGQAVITQNQLTTVTLTMNSEITRVEILPVNVQFTGNGTTTLNAAAYNAAGELVLTNSWDWQNSNPAVLNLTPNGASADIQATGTGQTVITLTETETGTFATKTLQVTVNTTP